MSSSEDRLRGALRAEEPGPLDPERIIHGARRRRAVVRARIGAAAAVVVVAGAVGIPLAGQVGQSDAGRTAAAPDVAASAGSEPALPAARPPGPPEAGAEQGGRVDEIIPGRAVLVEAERWCVVDDADRVAPRCAALTVHTLRTTDSAGAEWLVALAPSGPATAALQVEQPSGWVNLRIARVAGTPEYWAGAVEGDRATATPARLRALDGRGGEIWSADR